MAHIWLRRERLRRRGRARRPGRSLAPDLHARLHARAARVISLDAKTASLDAVATLESDGATAPGRGSSSLTLSTERSAVPLATATTDVTGHARFTFAPSQLGPPGRGELRLRLRRKRGRIRRRRAVAPIERRAQVDARRAGGAGRTAPSRLAGGRRRVRRRRRARGAGRTEVTSGSVEARVGDSIVGAAPVEGGSAKLLVTFGLPESAGASSEVAIALRYLPSAPWYEPGAESQWRLPVKGRSPLRQAWVLAAGLAVAACFVVARAQRARAMAKALRRPRARARARRKRSSTSCGSRVTPSEGWKGRVTDADDGDRRSPAARVQIERPAFGRAEVLGSVVTDDEGRFELPAIDAPPGRRAHHRSAASTWRSGAPSPSPASSMPSSSSESAPSSVASSRGRSSAGARSTRAPSRRRGTCGTPRGTTSASRAGRTPSSGPRTRANRSTPRSKPEVDRLAPSPAPAPPAEPCRPADRRARQEPPRRSPAQPTEPQSA